MILTRRSLIAGMGAAAIAAGPARAATASRRFIILRSGSDIGRHDISLIRQGRDVRVEIDIEIVVRILGIAAYRYEMTNREVWRGGMLQSVDCSVNDDGKRKRLTVSRAGDSLGVDGDSYSGHAPGDAVTTTYHARDFMQRGAWISTDSGELYAMQIAPAGSSQVETGVGLANCSQYRATNGNDFNVLLSYADVNDQWASVAFDAGGELAVYRPDTLDSDFTAVWRD